MGAWVHECLLACRLRPTLLQVGAMVVMVVAMAMALAVVPAGGCAWEGEMEGERMEGERVKDEAGWGRVGGDPNCAADPTRVGSQF